MVNETVKQTTVQSKVGEMPSIDDSMADILFKEYIDTQSVALAICEYVRRNNSEPARLQRYDCGGYYISRKITLPDFKTSDTVMPGLAHSDIELEFRIINGNEENTKAIFGGETNYLGCSCVNHLELIIKAESKETLATYLIVDSNITGTPNKYQLSAKGTTLVNYLEHRIWTPKMSQNYKNFPEDKPEGILKQANNCYAGLTRAILHYISDTTKTMTKHVKVDEPVKVPEGGLVKKI